MKLVIKAARIVVVMNVNAEMEHLPASLQSICSIATCWGYVAFACEVLENIAQVAGALLLQQRVDLLMGLRMSRLIMAG